jgi:hypothetical protein
VVKWRYWDANDDLFSGFKKFNVSLCIKIFFLIGFFMQEKLRQVSNGLLCIGLGFLALTRFWWPNLLILLGFYFAFRNVCEKNYFRALAILLIYAICYCYFTFPFFFFMNWEWVTALVLFTLGSLRILGAFFRNKKRV